jgi:hypothetical protein
MNHAHTWRVTATVLLELPDARGYADRFIAWQCPCGQASGSRAPSVRGAAPDAGILDPADT